MQLPEASSSSRGRRALALAAALVLFVLPAPGGAADPLDLNILLPLTGTSSFAGAAQVQTVKAIEGYVNRTGGINGRPLHFVVHDDQTSPQLDVQLANQVIGTHPAVLLGPNTAAQCGAVMPLVKSGPVLYCFNPLVRPEPGSTVFATGPRTEYLAESSLRYLGLRGLKRVAIISSTDATGQTGDKMVAEVSARENVVTIVDRQYFNPTDVSVAAQLAHIKAARPDAIYVYTSGTQLGTVLRGLQDGGFSLPVMVASSNLVYAELQSFAQIVPKELLFPGQAFLTPNQVTDKGVKAAVNVMYEALAAEGAKPDQGHNSTWDGVMIVISALKKLGPAATSEQIRAYIAGLQDWPGVDGRYNFHAEPQRGLGPDCVVVVRWDGSKSTFVAVSKPGGKPL